MTYTKKQFLEDVKKEAVALKRNLTKEERERLDYSSFKADDSMRCIYGQIGKGDCRSFRSAELIEKCCKKFVHNDVYSELRLAAVIQEKPFSAIKKYVNGSKSPDPTSLMHISSIETYIVLPYAKNKNLIDFLKGNRKDLVL